VEKYSQGIGDDDMSFPFGKIIEDENADPTKVYLWNPKYKTIPIGSGEPPRFKEVIDWDATAKASAVIYNIGEGK
jgi:hypothetical protein